MSLKCYYYSNQIRPQLLPFHNSNTLKPNKLSGTLCLRHTSQPRRRPSSIISITTVAPPQHFYRISASLQELDLTEDNVNQVLSDAREKFSHIFDTSVGMTGVVELAELDGPFVKISLRGRFWHERSLILARIGNYLKQRIPEILEVDIEDEKQLDDSPENF